MTPGGQHERPDVPFLGLPVDLFGWDPDSPGPLAERFTADGGWAAAVVATVELFRRAADRGWKLGLGKGEPVELRLRLADLRQYSGGGLSDEQARRLLAILAEERLIKSMGGKPKRGRPKRGNRGTEYRVWRSLGTLLGAKKGAPAVSWFPLPLVVLDPPTGSGALPRPYGTRGLACMVGLFRKAHRETWAAARAWGRAHREPPAFDLANRYITEAGRWRRHKSTRAPKVIGWLEFCGLLRVEHVGVSGLADGQARRVVMFSTTVEWSTRVVRPGACLSDPMTMTDARGNGAGTVREPRGNGDGSGPIYLPGWQRIIGQKGPIHGSHGGVPYEGPLEGSPGRGPYEGPNEVGGGLEGDSEGGEAIHAPDKPGAHHQGRQLDHIDEAWASALAHHGYKATHLGRKDHERLADLVASEELTRTELQGALTNYAERVKVGDHWQCRQGRKDPNVGGFVNLSGHTGWQRDLREYRHGKHVDKTLGELEPFPADRCREGRPKTPTRARYEAECAIAATFGKELPFGRRSTARKVLTGFLLGSAELRMDRRVLAQALRLYLESTPPMPRVDAKGDEGFEVNAERWISEAFAYEHPSTPPHPGLVLDKGDREGHARMVARAHKGTDADQQAWISDLWERAHLAAGTDQDRPNRYWPIAWETEGDQTKAGKHWWGGGPPPLWGWYRLLDRYPVEAISRAMQAHAVAKWSTCVVDGLEERASLSPTPVTLLPFLEALGEGEGAPRRAR